MSSESAGAGATRPPAAPGPQLRFRERFEQVSLRVPFAAKLAAVWLAIVAVLAVLFSAAKFDTTWMRENFWFITKGLWVTVFIAVVSIFFAIVLALLGALGRLSRNPVAYGVTGFYTSFFRGTPLIVQMFLIYLGLPTIGQAFPQSVRPLFLLSAIVAGITALSLNYGAYMTEIFRAGIQSVSHGQSEAAEALGMTYRQKMRRVVLPQAFRVIVPPTGNEFIAMMKDTALVSLLGTPIAWADPFRRSTLLGRADFRNLEALLVAAAWYWILTGIFTFFQRRLETRLSKGYVRQVAGPRARGKGPPGPPVPAGTTSVAGPGGALIQIPSPLDESTESAEAPKVETPARGDGRADEGWEHR